MELVHGLPQPINDLPTVLTIGAFDGVHRGHQHLIGLTVRRALALGCQSAVLTFDPHPDLVVRPERQRLYLASLEERLDQIAALGVDLLIVLPFTRELMALRAHEFMHKLCGAVALRELWAGPDTALGYRREGNIAKLREIGQELGYHVQPVEPLLVGGAPVSSTRIREALSAGDVGAAGELLGHPFELRGVVVEGDRRGRTIGFPTANMAIDPQHVVPGNGVYVCKARLGDVEYGAVTNVGVRPTFSADQARPTVEAFLLDFTGDIYGETLQLQFLERLRGEQKFDGVAALVAQITRDVAAARAKLEQGV